VPLPVGAEPVVQPPREGDKVMRAVNLRTGGELVFVGITPEEALIAAYAQERNDCATWGCAGRCGRLIERGRRTMACCDWCVMAAGGLTVTRSRIPHPASPGVGFPFVVRRRRGRLLLLCMTT
jgi:hypothetical protein